MRRPSLALYDIRNDNLKRLEIGTLQNNKQNHFYKLREQMLDLVWWERYTNFFLNTLFYEGYLSWSLISRRHIVTKNTKRIQFLPKI